MQDEGEDRYLIFGNLLFVVAPLQCNSRWLANPTMTGNISDSKISSSLMLPIDTSQQTVKLENDKKLLPPSRAQHNNGHSGQRDNTPNKIPLIRPYSFDTP